MVKSVTMVMSNKTLSWETRLAQTSRMKSE